MTTAALCACCEQREGTRPVDFSGDHGLGRENLCDWCEESLIEGATMADLAERIVARRFRGERAAGPAGPAEAQEQREATGRVKVRVVRAEDYVPVHRRRGPMKFTELEVSETVSKTGRKTMKFSEVIAALEDGKKVAYERDDSYVVLVAPGSGLKSRLIRVYSDGSWVTIDLKFDGPLRDNDKWGVVE